MAKTISVKLRDKECVIVPVKVERSKIYGWSQVRAITPEGEICTQGGINNDGINLVDAGCTKIGLITDDGKWMDRSELKAYRSDGSLATLNPSTFDEGIELSEKATLEDLLDLNVTAVYQLSAVNLSEIIEEIGDDIYRCTFSYRGGYDLSDAFVMAVENQLFILTGNSGTYTPVAISQEGVLDDDLDDNLDEDYDELDFSMM